MNSVRASLATEWVSGSHRRSSRASAAVNRWWRRSRRPTGPSPGSCWSTPPAMTTTSLRPWKRSSSGSPTEGRRSSPLLKGSRPSSCRRSRRVKVSRRPRSRPPRAGSPMRQSPERSLPAPALRRSPPSSPRSPRGVRTRSRRSRPSAKCCGNVLKRFRPECRRGVGSSIRSPSPRPGRRAAPRRRRPRSGSRPTTSRWRAATASIASREPGGSCSMARETSTSATIRSSTPRRRWPAERNATRKRPRSSSSPMRHRSPPRRGCRGMPPAGSASNGISPRSSGHSSRSSTTSSVSRGCSTT